MKMSVYRKDENGNSIWPDIEVSDASNDDLLSHISNIASCDSRKCPGDEDTTDLDNAVWAEALRRMSSK